jgi:hypothetical protein
MRTDKPTPDRVIAACQAIVAHVPDAPNPYNLTRAELDAVEAALALLTQKAEAQRQGALAQAQRVRDKDAALLDAGRVLSEATRVALASSADAGQLSLIGMARPAKPTRPTSLPAPSKLVATPLAPSKTRLSWDRNAPYGATFQVFWSPDGYDYRIVATTTKARLDLDAAAGVPAWYKVRAVRSGLESDFSGEVSVYAPGVPARPALKVA